VLACTDRQVLVVKEQGDALFLIHTGQRTPASTGTWAASSRTPVARRPISGQPVLGTPWYDAIRRRQQMTTQARLTKPRG
jgi:hypothetical protein